MVNDFVSRNFAGNCLSGCQYRDIGFLVDSSGSIAEDNTFELMQRFIKRIIGRIDIGPTRNLVGLVQFSDIAYTVFTLNTFANRSKADIYKEIDDTALLHGNTDIALGLRLMFTHTLSIISRSRHTCCLVMMCIKGYSYYVLHHLLPLQSHRSQHYNLRQRPHRLPLWNWTRPSCNACCT